MFRYLLMIRACHHASSNAIFMLACSTPQSTPKILASMDYHDLVKPIVSCNYS